MSDMFCYKPRQPQGQRPPHHHTPNTTTERNYAHLIFTPGHLPWNPGATVSSTNTPTPAFPANYTHTRRGSMDDQGQHAWASHPWGAHPRIVPGVPAPPTPAPGPPYSVASFSPTPYGFHPLLGPGKICFDLSLQVYVDGEPIPVQTLFEPATHPPTSRLEIESDRIPQWPILLDSNPATPRASHPPFAPPPPHLTLGDVLWVIHQMMQTQIAQGEWVWLGGKERTKVTKAYRQRCNQAPEYENDIAQERVKRVDFLHGKVVFAGLEGDRRHEEKVKFLVKRRER